MATTVSVRLDDDALRALVRLERLGVSRSEAIRSAILGAAARLRAPEALRAEVEALEADKADRREMAEVAALMEAMRAEG
jgi:Arc/MetJ-type ribon-helix-helix transcriptional regulator